MPGSSLAEMGVSEGLKERAGPSHSVVQGERQEGPGWLASLCPLPALQRVAYKQSRAVLKVNIGVYFSWEPGRREWLKFRQQIQLDIFGCSNVLVL